MKLGGHESRVVPGVQLLRRLLVRHQPRHVVVAVARPGRRAVRVEDRRRRRRGGRRLRHARGGGGRERERVAAGVRPRRRVVVRVKVVGRDGAVALAGHGVVVLARPAAGGLRRRGVVPHGGGRHVARGRRRGRHVLVAGRRPVDGLGPLGPLRSLLRLALALLELLSRRLDGQEGRGLDARGGGVLLLLLWGRGRFGLGGGVWQGGRGVMRGEELLMVTSQVGLGGEIPERLKGT